MSNWKNEFNTKFPYLDVKLPYKFSGENLIKDLQKASKNVGMPCSEILDYEIGPKVTSKFDSVILEFGNIRTSKIIRDDSHSKVRLYFGVMEEDRIDLRIFLEEFKSLYKDDEEE